LLLPGLLASTVTALVLFAALGGSSVIAWLVPPTPPPPMDYGVRFEWPGIQRPPTMPAAVAPLSDDEPVIGLCAGDRSRAYAVRALSQGPTSHIINDVVSNVPVTVTHCDIYRCSRVYTGGVPGEPLDLSQGGLRARGMVLKCGGHAYRQDSGAALDADSPPFPYASYPAEVTIWGRWRAEHPDSDLYCDGLFTPEQMPPGVVFEPPPGPPAPPPAVTPGDIVAVRDPVPWLLFAPLSALPFACTLLAFLSCVLLGRFVRPRKRGHSSLRK
jgi:hypothetical protein